MLWLLHLLTLAQSPTDAALEKPPSPPLVVVQEATSVPEALDLVEDLVALRIEEDPEGIHYLYGHLLEASGQGMAASEAFAVSIAYTPALEQYSRLRLARLEAQRGHPEVAAGLTASILRGKPRPGLITETTRLLISAIDGGGDCRLLARIPVAGLPDRERRDLQVQRSRCEAKSVPQSSIAKLLAILEEDEGDDAARIAADELLGHPGLEQTEGLGIHLGRAFHHHRRFDLAITYLQPIVERLPPEIRKTADFDLYYLLARSHFWREDFVTAAREFSALAARTVDLDQRTKALYQAGRSFELAGSWPVARARFAAAAAITPSSHWTGPAILSAFRIDWRRGRETEALGTYKTLRSRSSWNQYAAQAALFLAASDIVQGRDDRAGNWLAQASARRADRVATLYWRGRLAELGAHWAAAIDFYRKLLSDAPYHPLALETLDRLEQPTLRTAADRAVARGLEASELSIRTSAWHLTGRPGSRGGAASKSHPYRATLTRSIYQSLTRSSATAPFVGLAPAAVSEWPLWQRSRRQLDELLLALGRWDEVELSPILRLFPTREPALAFAASTALFRAGDTRKSLYVAEALRRRVPRTVPEPLLPIPFRQRLYPLPYRQELTNATREHGADPYLLLAVMREESRFDPYALSAAAARGLTQFILPTADRIAASIDLPTPIDADSLYEPEMAIALGAAYLSQLDREFDGRRPATVAAYNAGEHQARLWASYCFSDDDGEYLTKVGFKETRAYLERVLGSQQQYQELYPSLVP